MSDPLLERIIADLDDDTPRLIWADREGGLAGDLVIVQCQLEARDLPRAERWRLKQLERGLIERRQKVEELVTGNTTTSWRRGFAYAIHLQQDELLEHGARVVERYPLISEISTFLQVIGTDCSAEEAWKQLEEPLEKALASFPLLRRFDGQAVALDARSFDEETMELGEQTDCSDGLVEVLARVAPGLAALHLHGSPTPRGFEILERLPKLEALEVRGPRAPRLRDIPELLRRLPALTRLGVSVEDDVTDEMKALTHTPECQRLTHLSLFETIDRESVITLAKLTNLTALALRTREAFPVAELASHENFEELELHAPITNADIAIFARAPFAARLKILSLSDARLTNDAIPDLLSFPNLERLYLSSSDIDALDSLEAVIPDVQSA